MSLCGPTVRNASRVGDALLVAGVQLKIYIWDVIQDAAATPDFMRKLTQSPLELIRFPIHKLASCSNRRLCVLKSLASFLESNDWHALDGRQVRGLPCVIGHLVSNIAHYNKSAISVLTCNFGKVPKKGLPRYGTKGSKSCWH